MTIQAFEYTTSIPVMAPFYPSVAERPCSQCGMMFDSILLLAKTCSSCYFMSLDHPDFWFPRMRRRVYGGIGWVWWWTVAPGVWLFTNISRASRYVSQTVMANEMILTRAQVHRNLDGTYVGLLDDADARQLMAA